MIWVDYRERCSGVIESLKKKGYEYEVKSLQVGDYIVSGTYIERKTSPDFIVSLKTGRLFKQIKELKKQGRQQLLIIEGLPLKLIRGASYQAIDGALIAIAVSWQLPVLYSECPAETAEILNRIRKQIIKRSDLKSRKIYLKKKSRYHPIQKKKILESMPTIGPHLANGLLDKFGSLEKIFNASEQELMKIKGIGKGKAKKIKDVIKEEKALYKCNSIFIADKN